MLFIKQEWECTLPVHLFAIISIKALKQANFSVLKKTEAIFCEKKRATEVARFNQVQGLVFTFV